MTTAWGDIHKGIWLGLALYHTTGWLFKKRVQRPLNVSPLMAKQIFFLKTISQFIQDSVQLGYQCTAGEAWRSPETCALYAKEGKGITQSVHQERLAMDLNFFKDGVSLQTVEACTFLGNLWERYSTPEFKCCAGVFFSNPDTDHFSVEHNGIR